jgi:hypothetical protein
MRLNAGEPQESSTHGVYAEHRDDADSVGAIRQGTIAAAAIDAATTLRQALDRDFGRWAPRPGIAKRMWAA